jgi:hypothetical protein
MEAILVEWESFAATLLPAPQGMSPLELRDHARPIREAVAIDLSAPHTRRAQVDKSRVWRRYRISYRKRQRRPMRCCAPGAASDINQL